MIGLGLCNTSLEQYYKIVQLREFRLLTPSDRRVRVHATSTQYRQGVLAYCISLSLFDSKLCDELISFVNLPYSV